VAPLEQTCLAYITVSVDYFQGKVVYLRHEHNRNHSTQKWSS